MGGSSFDDVQHVDADSGSNGHAPLRDELSTGRLRRLIWIQVVLLVLAIVAGGAIAAIAGRAILHAEHKLTEERTVHAQLIGVRNDFQHAHAQALQVRAGERRSFDPALAVAAWEGLQRMKAMIGHVEDLDPPIATRARAVVDGYGELASLYGRYLASPIGSAEGRRLSVLANPRVQVVQDLLEDWITAEANEIDTLAISTRASSRRIVTIMVLLLTILALATTGVGVALARLRRSAITQRLEQAQRDDDAAFQNVLRQVALMIARHEPGSQLTSLIAHEAAALTGAAASAVVRFEIETGSIRSIATFGPPGVVSEMAITAGNGVLAQVARTGLPAHVESYSSLPALDPARIAANAADMESGMAVPVRDGNELWGALLVLAAPGCRLPQSEHQLARLAELVETSLSSVAERERLERDALCDSLTGLANHRAFDLRIREALETATSEGRPLSLALLDIDHFKHVNDTHGHLVGDDVLTEFAQRLTRHVRDGDFVARIGGEEFAIVLLDTCGDEATEIVDRVRIEACAEPFPVVGRLTLSGGISHWGSEVDDPLELKRRADVALYWSKNNGRSRVAHYDCLMASHLNAVSGSPETRAPRLSALSALARAVDAKDPYTSRHSTRVADLAVSIAAEMGWSREAREALREAALLHDVGKIGVPDAVLLKAGPLTDDERNGIQRHSEIGAEITRDVLSADQVSWIRHHHERVDGTGYPDAIDGDAIPEGALVLAVADGWDAMTQGRQYRPAFTTSEALAELTRCAGSQWSPPVVAALTAVIQRVEGALPSLAT